MFAAVVLVPWWSPFAYIGLYVVVLALYQAWPKFAAGRAATAERSARSPRLASPTLPRPGDRANFYSVPFDVTLENFPGHEGHVVTLTEDLSDGWRGTCECGEPSIVTLEGVTA